MLVVSLLLFSLALAFTPFFPGQSATGDSEGKKHGRLFSFLRRRKTTDSPTFIGRLKKKNTKNTDLGLVVAEVATRLRSGAQPDEAWHESLKSVCGDKGEKGLDEHGVPLGLRALWKKPQRLFGKKKSAGHTQLAIPAAIAVCRLSHSSGAPIAEVLDSCASGITEAAEAASARSVALAGPQTSAQMLAWLPLIGIVLGSVLGAEPVHFLLSTTVGRFVFVLGLACEVAGIVWVRKLVAKAEKL